MTVSDLLTQLQELDKNGGGNLDVCIFIPYDCGVQYWTTAINADIKQNIYYKTIDGYTQGVKNNKFLGLEVTS